MFGAAISLDFAHIRSRRGLARMVRKIAFVLRKVVIKEFEERKLVREKMKAGDIEGTSTVWKNVYEDYILEEKDITKILRDEEMLLNDERKSIAEEENILKDSITELSRSYPDKVRKVEEFYKKLQEAMSSVAETARKMRVEEKDMLLDRERVLKYATMLGDKRFADTMLTRAIRVIGWEEGHDIFREQQDEGRVKKVLSRLHSSISSKKEQDIDAALDELLAVGEDLKKAYILESQEAYKLVHYLNIIHVHLLHKVMNEEPKLIMAVTTAGYPVEKLKAIKAMYKRFADLHNEYFKYYTMARYVEKRAA